MCQINLKRCLKRREAGTRDVNKTTYPVKRKRNNNGGNLKYLKMEGNKNMNR